MLSLIIRLYTFVVLASVVASWVRAPEDHPVVRGLRRLTDPVLDPLRRVLPTVGGLDFSPLVLLLLLQVLERLLYRY